MSAVLTPIAVQKPPPAAASRGAPPSAKKWTRQEFMDLGAQGLLEGRRAMLIEGEIWEEGMMNPPHATGIQKASRWLHRAFPTGFDIRGQMPLDLGAETMPLPDLVVVRGSTDDYSRRHPIAGDVALIIEVADTSLKFDTTTKVEYYALAGIPEYWVVDTVNRVLIVHRNPVGPAYQSKQTLAPSDSIAAASAPNSVVSIGDLLP